jgi:predicted glycosyltransferase
VSRTPKRLLVYSHDTFGLGNIRRMLAIARRLVEVDADVNVLIISGSPMLHAFRIPPRIDYLKLPCLSRSIGGDYGVRFLELDYAETVQMRSNLIASAVRDFQPDLILVDKKPLGVDNELEAALAHAHRAEPRPRLVLLLRDILDSPESTVPIWSRHGYHDLIADLYDEVLVVGSPEIFDVAREYAFPPSTVAKLCYCGYIGRARGRTRRAETRRALGVGREKLVVVTVGGGEDGRFVMASYLAGLVLEPDRDGMRTVMVCGPEMPERERREVRRRAAGLRDVTVLEFSDDIMALLEAADLVVAMGGYNTVCEIMSARKRAILIPRIKPVQEQWIRAERLARHGLARVIHPDRLTPLALIRAVHEELARGHVHGGKLYRLDMRGLDRVAGRLLGTRSAESRPALATLPVGLRLGAAR